MADIPAIRRGLKSRLDPLESERTVVLRTPAIQEEKKTNSVPVEMERVVTFTEDINQDVIFVKEVKYINLTRA